MMFTILSHRQTFLLLCGLGSALSTAVCPSATAANPTSMPSNPMRPATLTWGGYNGNEQFIGAQDQWPFVQKYMDGYLMHGAYWLNHRHTGGPVSESSVMDAAKALGAALDRNGKTANVETGWLEKAKYNQEDPQSRAAFTRAESDIAAFHKWADVGVHVSKVRIDWFPIQTAAIYAEKYKTTSVQQLLAMITGATQFWGTVPGFDPDKASWREYCMRVNRAYPNIELGFDQAPCNFYPVQPDPAVRSLVPWKPFGYGYLTKGLSLVPSQKQIQVNGKPVPFSLDFADLMLSVALASRQWGLNYYGFEGDTPYHYITENKGRPGKDLLPFLLNIERTQHEYGFHNAKIINTTPDKSLPHVLWDKVFHDGTLAFLELYQKAGGRADQYIAESWYVGPYEFFPETKRYTFSNLVRDLIRRLRGIDDNGIPFHADLAVRLANSSDWLGDHVYQQEPSGPQVVSVDCTKPVVVTLRIRNDSPVATDADCRATPLLRGSGASPAGWKITMTSDADDVTDAVMCQKQFDGFYVGGLNPGECKTLRISAMPSPAAAHQYLLRLSLYWNPQDPKAVVRDCVQLTFTH